MPSFFEAPSSRNASARSHARDVTMCEPRIGERPCELLCTCEPIGGELLERLPQGDIDVGRHRLPDRGRRHRQTLDDLAEHRLSRVADVRGLTDQHLVQDTRERVGVARGPHDLVSRRLLGRHVEGSPDRETGLGQAVATGRSDRQRDSEVRDQRLSSAQEDVGGLDIAVDDPLVVGRLKGVGHSGRHAKGFVDR